MVRPSSAGFRGNRDEFTYRIASVEAALASLGAQYWPSPRTRRSRQLERMAMGVRRTGDELAVSMVSPSVLISIPGG